jgi:hypothetical protein
MQASTAQAPPSRQSLVSTQQLGMGVWLHTPLTQKSFVQMLSSSQSSGGLEQIPLMHVSRVQRFPSLQFSAVNVQPLVGETHASVVQGSPSSQITAV